MPPSDSESLDELAKNAGAAVAIEALWDGDTEGWFVDLCAVVSVQGGHESRHLRTFSRGGDIRIFNGTVPPWPEAVEAARLGEQLAARLGVPFHFPSPTNPEHDCPHWWELDRSSPCRRCGIPLLQVAPRPWKGVCHHCHCAIERERTEAAWTPDERHAPRCSRCGDPVVDQTSSSPWCRACREKYRSFACEECGGDITVSRDHWKGDVCSSCTMAKQLSALSPAERRRLRILAELDDFDAIVDARELLRCGISEARLALAVLSESPVSSDESTA